MSIQPQGKLKMEAFVSMSDESHSVHSWWLSTLNCKAIYLFCLVCTIHTHRATARAWLNRDGAITWPNVDRFCTLTVRMLTGLMLWPFTLVAWLFTRGHCGFRFPQFLASASRHVIAPVSPLETLVQFLSILKLYIDQVACRYAAETGWVLTTESLGKLIWKIK